MKLVIVDPQAENIYECLGITLERSKELDIPVHEAAKKLIFGEDYGTAQAMADLAASANDIQEYTLMAVSFVSGTARIKADLERKADTYIKRDF